MKSDIIQQYLDIPAREIIKNSDEYNNFKAEVQPKHKEPITGAMYAGDEIGMVCIDCGGILKTEPRGLYVCEGCGHTAVYM